MGKFTITINIWKEQGQKAVKIAFFILTWMSQMSDIKYVNSKPKWFINSQFASAGTRHSYEAAK